MTNRKKPARKRKLPASMTAAAADPKNPAAKKQSGATLSQLSSRSVKTSIDGAYEVGYRKTPKHTRFPKGVSGNPKGRPKGSRNLSTILEAALTERVPVRRNGKTKKMRLIDTIAASLANKGASGHLAAIRLLLETAIKLGIFADSPPTKTNATKLAQEEQDVLDQIGQMLNRSAKGKNEGN